MRPRTAAEGFARAAERGLLPIAYAGARGVLAAPAPTVRGWMIAGLARRLEDGRHG